MKKLLLSLTLGAFAFSGTYAQHVGIGTNTPTSKLHVVDPSLNNTKLLVESDNNSNLASISMSNMIRAGGISMGYVNNLPTYGDAGETYIYSSANMLGLNIINQNTTGNGHIAMYTSGNHSNTATLYLSDADNVGIGNEAPTERLHVTGGARITSLSGVGMRMVVANANGVLSTQAIPAGGDITSVTAGDGLVGGGTTGAVTLTAAADNGLYVNAAADRIRMGGPLVEATTITHGTNTLTYNLDNTGDFRVQDAGVNTFLIRDDGIGYYGDDFYWRDGNTGGTNLARIIDSGNDGRFQVYRDGAVNHDIHGAGATVFNQGSFDQDFRVESNGNTNMVFVDGGTNQVGIGTANLTQTLDINGNADVNQGTYFLRDAAGATYGIGYNTEGGTQMAIFSDDLIQFTESDADVVAVHISTNTRRMGINTTAPTRSLDVNGTVRIRGGNPDAGDLLMAQDANGNATWSAAGYGMVPIGSIVAWHGNMAGVPGLPTGWLECNGQAIVDAASPMNGQNVPNLNGGTTSSSGDASRGRFLRGHTTSGLLQADQANNLYWVNHDDSGNGDTNDYLDDDGTTVTIRNYSTNGDRYQCRLEGIENRVVNMSVRWIMRVK